MIERGYILQPRSWDYSKAAHFPPVVREVWFYLLRNVNHADNETCKRGEGWFTLDMIQSALSWSVGYRVMRYSKPQLTKALRKLRDAEMISRNVLYEGINEGMHEGNAKATTKTITKATHGIFVSVNNYDEYQTAKNYEGNDEGNNEEITKDLRRNSKGNANKNEKNVKKEEKESEGRECALETEPHTLFENSNLNGNGKPKKEPKIRQKAPKVDFSEGACFANPGFTNTFCAGKWQQWCIEKTSPYRTQKIAEEALSYLYELSEGDENLAIAALRDAYTSGWQSFKWYFKHLEKEQKRHDHAHYQNSNGKSAPETYGADNLFWLESHRDCNPDAGRC
jgi:hypothetical protein